MAWRCHDAQYWGKTIIDNRGRVVRRGTPQRRRRISVVADFGGECAGEILFERESLQRNHQQSTTERERAESDITCCAGRSDREIIETVTLGHDERQSLMPTDGTTDTLMSTDYKQPMIVAYDETIAIEGNGGRESHHGDGYSKTDKMYTLNTVEVHGVAYGIDSEKENVPYTLKIRAGCDGGGKGPLTQKNRSATLSCNNDQTLFEPKVYCICAYESNSMKSSNPHSGIYESDTSRTLDLNGGDPSCNQGGMAVCEPHAYDMTHADDVIRDCGECSPTLQNRMGTGGNQVPLTIEKKTSWVARKLMPIECERLQGFPDNWTDIGEWIDSKGKKHKPYDTPRYKAIGNSICLPFWDWMLKRMAQHLPEHATLGSLFDGIGGFPLIWERIHGAGTARWASEIEEFCIAVTKRHFPEEDNGS